MAGDCSISHRAHGGLTSTRCHPMEREGKCSVRVAAVLKKKRRKKEEVGGVSVFFLGGGGGGQRLPTL